MPLPTTPDLHSWQPWLTRHRTPLFLLARQYLPTPQEAEDAVHNGFINFWSARHSAKDATALLFTCVRSAALDLRRANSARTRREHAIPPPSPYFLTPLENAERHQQIEAALQKLPEPQREVLILKLWSDLTFSQIAATLKIPLHTASSRYRYALAHLKTLLTKEFKNA